MKNSLLALGLYGLVVTAIAIIMIFVTLGPDSDIDEIVHINKFSHYKSCPILAHTSSGIVRVPYELWGRLLNASDSGQQDVWILAKDAGWVTGKDFCSVNKYPILKGVWSLQESAGQ
jgi:hypothetical protein